MKVYENDNSPATRNVMEMGQKGSTSPSFPLPVTSAGNRDMPVV